VIVLAELALGVISICCAAIQPPKGPVAALLKQRTVHTFPAEAKVYVLAAATYHIDESTYIQSMPDRWALSWRE
jgi:hypothetical protein